jgi:hypothetical protein
MKIFFLLFLYHQHQKNVDNERHAVPVNRTMHNVSFNFLLFLLLSSPSEATKKKVKKSLFLRFLFFFGKIRKSLKDDDDDDEEEEKRELKCAFSSLSCFG